MVEINFGSPTVSGAVEATLETGAEVGISPVTIVKKFLTVSASTVRTTIATPTSGKKIRVHHVSMMASNGAALSNAYVYFGTGADISTDATKAVFLGTIDDTVASPNTNFPIGREPVGDTDEVLSVLTNVSTTGLFVVHYSEEV